MHLTFKILEKKNLFLLNTVQFILEKMKHNMAQNGSAKDKVRNRYDLMSCIVILCRIFLQKHHP